LMNRPGPFFEDIIQETNKYYNIYKTFPVPYNLLMYVFVVLDSLSPVFARKLYRLIGGIAFPSPVDGSVVPEPLKETDMSNLDLNGIQVRGWDFGSINILPTPGHTPCSISLYWPEKKALFTSDADWIGNPVFMSSSIRDSIMSLSTMKELTSVEKVDLLLPGHGQVKKSSERILAHLNLRINLLETLRDEVLNTYQSFGKERDVRKLTKVLTQESQLFSTLKLVNSPRHVYFVLNIVGVCLREEGILK
jgi:glyoxylase-like metal-dependent hydrolase (beta-lactamase superfamily II)